MMDTILDWKTLLCKVLHAFGEEEGTWYSNRWHHYGISNEALEIIEKAYFEYMETLDG